jgi:hypothetical protein
LLELATDTPVEFKQPESQGTEGLAGLSFDPFTGAALGWFLLKVGGEACVALTGAILGEVIHKRMQARAELARKTVRVRFPDGTLYVLVVDNAQSMSELRNLISQKTGR